jgi:hypothetical protein
MLLVTIGGVCVNGCVMILLDSILLLLSPKYLVHNKMDEQNYHPDIQRPRARGDGRETRGER